MRRLLDLKLQADDVMHRQISQRQTWVELPEDWRLAGIQFSSLGGV
jgi:hypothetical protein